LDNALLAQLRYEHAIKITVLNIKSSYSYRKNFGGYWDEMDSILWSPDINSSVLLIEYLFLSQVFGHIYSGMLSIHNKCYYRKKGELHFW